MLPTTKTAADTLNLMPGLFAGRTDDLSVLQTLISRTNSKRPPAEPFSFKAFGR
jgi:hypothetical protein